MIRIVENACHIAEGKLVVVIEGDSPEELMTNNIMHAAVEKAASCGYHRFGINKTSGIYPVDAEGKSHDDWNEQSRQGQIVAYRNDVWLMGGL